LLTSFNVILMSAIARTRLVSLGRQVHHTLSLGDKTPTILLCYSIHMNVRHDEKSIDFITESISPIEKVNVYHRQKRLMRTLYPEYMFTEKHT